MSARKPRSPKHVVFLLLSALITFVICEGIAQIFVHINAPSRQEFLKSYLTPVKFHAINAFVSLNHEVGANGLRVIHPYFGFLDNPQLSYVNPDGFMGPTISEYKRAPGDFVVGIFGGSVASILGNFEFHTGYLSKKLKERLPILAHKNLKIFDLGVGAHKQPQAYLINSFYAGLFDLTINVDGFNEIAYDTNNGHFPASYPEFSNFYFNPSLTRVPLQLLGFWLARESGDLRDWINGDSLVTRSALVDVVTLSSLEISRQALNYLMDISLYPETNKKLKMPALDFAAKGAALWREFSVKQERLNHGWGVKSYFFIQPNQYLPGRHELTEEEIKLGVTSYSQSAIDVIIKGYAELENETRDLKKQGFPVYDLTWIFKDIHEPIYIDDCCHYNDRGNQILVDHIVDILAETQTHPIGRVHSER